MSRLAFGLLCFISSSASAECPDLYCLGPGSVPGPHLPAAVLGRPRIRRRSNRITGTSRLIDDRTICRVQRRPACSEPGHILRISTLQPTRRRST
jgi:hypothetical protein